eukprot:1706797-Rhodomonas_salina.3
MRAEFYEMRDPHNTQTYKKYIEIAKEMLRTMHVLGISVKKHCNEKRTGDTWKRAYTLYVNFSQTLWMTTQVARYISYAVTTLVNAASRGLIQYDCISDIRALLDTCKHIANASKFAHNASDVYVAYTNAIQRSSAPQAPTAQAPTLPLRQAPMNWENATKNTRANFQIKPQPSDQIPEERPEDLTARYALQYPLQSQYPLQAQYPLHAQYPLQAQYPMQYPVPYRLDCNTICQGIPGVFTVPMGVFVSTVPMPLLPPLNPGNVNQFAENNTSARNVGNAIAAAKRYVTWLNMHPDKAQRKRGRKMGQQVSLLRMFTMQQDIPAAECLTLLGKLKESMLATYLESLALPPV